MADVHDPIDMGVAARLLDKDRPQPIATCHNDDEPLICTLEFRKAEFYCQVCGRKYGFLGPKPAEWTAERQARLDELEALYEIDRLSRVGQSE